MPRKKQETVSTEVVIEKAMDMDTPERFKMSESGYTGLNIFNGVSAEELNSDLRFPRSVKTFKEMSYHSTINSATTLFDNLISKVNWYFLPPENATEQEKRQCEIISEMMHDMDESWFDFISDLMSANRYGFTVHEKVFRRRLVSNGSKYNDGVIGWKKLPIRSQETIEKFIFDDTGNEVIGVKQNKANVSDPYNRYQNKSQDIVVLPRSKFILFRVGKHRGDPFGKSPLTQVYSAWRYLNIIEEIEANGVAKDLTGFPILTIPAKYMSRDASPEDKAIFESYKNALRNLQLNQQSGMIFPSLFDPESRSPLFDIKLLSLDGKKGMDTSKIKEYYKMLILTSLFADVLVLGQSDTGSFAMAQVKNSLSGSQAEAILRNIVNTLQHDLVRQTYELNGWDVSRMGHFDYDNLQAESLDELSKAFQRIASVGFLPRNHDVVNKGLVSMGIDPLDPNVNLDEVLTPMESRAGDGMEVGKTGNGTSDNVSATDNSSLNLENNG